MTSLPCSIGVGRSRIVAKVASEQAKPHGLLWVPPGAESSFLAPLPVRRIPGIGPVTEAALAGLGITRIGQLQAVPLDRLEEDFGRWGLALYRKARGDDAYEFFLDAQPKSVSHNQTFGEDTNDRARVESTVSYLCQKASKRVRDAGLAVGRVSLTLRYANFRTISRSAMLGEPSDLDTVLLCTVRELLRRAWDGVAKLRLVGVEFSAFTAGPCGQLDLLDPGRRERLERLARAADRLRDRFGFSKLQFGGSLAHREDRGE